MIFGVPLSQLPQELFGSDVIVEGQLNKVLPVSGTSAGKSVHLSLPVLVCFLHKQSTCSFACISILCSDVSRPCTKG